MINRDQLAELKVANARNKRKVQAHRTETAKVKAKIEHIDHPGTFPTNYKYG